MPTNPFHDLMIENAHRFLSYCNMVEPTIPEINAKRDVQELRKAVNDSSMTDSQKFDYINQWMIRTQMGANVQ